MNSSDKNLDKLIMQLQKIRKKYGNIHYNGKLRIIKLSDIETKEPHDTFIEFISKTN